MREVFTLTLREAKYHRNTCLQYLLHQQNLPTKAGACIWNHLQLLLPHHQHVIKQNHPCRETGPMAVLHTGVGGGPMGSTTTLDLVGTTLHLLRVSPNQMRALQRVGTHHVPFLQHPEWPNKSVLESHMRNAATPTAHPQPTNGEVREAYNLFWSTHKQPLPQAPRRGNKAHTGRQNKWSMYHTPRCQRYCSCHPTDSKQLCDDAQRPATCGCYRRSQHAPSVRNRCHGTG